MVLKSIQQKELYCNFETRLIYYEVTSVLVILLLKTHRPREGFKKKLTKPLGRGCVTAPLPPHCILSFVKIHLKLSENWFR